MNGNTAIVILIIAWLILLPVSMAIEAYEKSYKAPYERCLDDYSHKDNVLELCEGLKENE